MFMLTHTAPSGVLDVEAEAESAVAEPLSLPLPLATARWVVVCVVAVTLPPVEEAAPEVVEATDEEAA